MAHLNIAIDGPAGSGKSTIAKHIANTMGILYLDTGAMYRAMALKMIRKGISIQDAEAVKKELPTTEVFAENKNGTQVTYLDGEDVSSLIRTNEVSKGASDIAVIPEVRIKLVALQRKIAEMSDVVMDGRDIGSYVIPNTVNKFYVTATPQERARRRLLELHQKGMNLDKTLEEMRDEIVARDKVDSSREFAPLVRTEDAIYVDTTDMSIEDAVNYVMERIQK
ncbi:MAG: (d)CMP kinase [Clostridia bacterium]|nr:(d)CMP kinase [Clostridia bacterium]